MTDGRAGGADRWGAGGAERRRPAMRVLGHRGSPDRTAGIAENTIEAFVRSVELGADGVELDVRQARDGALVVHHDAAIPGAGVISELARTDLPPRVPLLGDVLDAMVTRFPGCMINIEIKNLPGEPGFDPDDGVSIAVAETVAELMAETAPEVGVVVSSFWPPALEVVGRARPEVPTGLLLASRLDTADAVQAALGRGCSALHPTIDLVTPELVDGAHAAGLSVAAWTVNDQAELERMADIGVDTVISDDVSLACRLRRGGGHGPGGAGGPIRSGPELGSRPDWSEGAFFNKNVRP